MICMVQHFGKVNLEIVSMTARNSNSLIGALIAVVIANRSENVLILPCVGVAMIDPQTQKVQF